MKTATLNAQRRQRAVEALEGQGVDALVVSSAENRRYLSGFSGSNGWLFLARDRAALVTDGRYWAQAERQCPDVELVKFRSKEDGRLSKRLAAWLADIGFTGTLGCEGRNLTVAAFEEAREDLPSLKALGGVVEPLRQVKSADEIEAIRRSAHVADQALRAALDSFREGVRERDLAAELVYQLQKAGAEKTSFDTIVASGENGAYPHAGATERAIRAGELVTVDFGGVVDGYCSDMTRTIWLGELDEKSREIYDVVRRSHRAAMDAVKPGLTGSDLDKVARDLIAAAGYGDAFSHSLGHGVGLEIHEAPGLRAESTAVMEVGMIITVEPGIYVPGLGGSRVEDLVVVTEGGQDSLSRSPYQEPGQEHPLEAWNS